MNKDQKRKILTEECLKSGNHKKLAVVWFAELSNIIDEDGIKFGIINRNKKK